MDGKTFFAKAGNLKMKDPQRENKQHNSPQLCEDECLKSYLKRLSGKTIKGKAGDPKPRVPNVLKDSDCSNLAGMKGQGFLIHP